LPTIRKAELDVQSLFAMINHFAGRNTMLRPIVDSRNVWEFTVEENGVSTAAGAQSVQRRTRGTALALHGAGR
jgi:hypothetical protein